ncbi:MAG: tetratricopeptide repeat protein, partial [Phycisphaerae bacterium]|nr:tetratricopeptide repeat protein [Phycisphaerae bacterium]
MDADTRHQLKQNELAEALEKLRDLNNPTTRYTIALVLVVIVFFASWKGWSYSRQHALEQTSQRLGELETILAGSDKTKVDGAINDLRTLIQETSHPALAGFARLLLARALSDQALAQPERRQEALGEAVAVLEEIVGSDGIPPMVEAAATYALATTYESLREFDQAAALYDRLLTDPRFKGSPYVLGAAPHFPWAADYVPGAKERLENLEDLKTPIKFEP